MILACLAYLAPLRATTRQLAPRARLLLTSYALRCWRSLSTVYAVFRAACTFFTLEPGFHISLAPLEWPLTPYVLSYALYLELGLFSF